MKKPPQKIAYLSRNSIVLEIFFLLPYICPTAQMAEFMLQNMAYRATVYIIGVQSYAICYSFNTLIRLKFPHLTLNYPDSDPELGPRIAKYFAPVPDIICVG